ncbi:hypothetical protein Taro_049564 [Colocasia esculenta]|uniref:Uncharacterized protein n=1 Tax=Colocasia esculenta TaxID=4460 RepID=A0A843XBA5_COLES|nr:hypothetical protein [Colocasia esculenta]
MNEGIDNLEPMNRFDIDGIQLDDTLLSEVQEEREDIYEDDDVFSEDELDFDSDNDEMDEEINMASSQETNHQVSRTPSSQGSTNASNVPTSRKIRKSRGKFKGLETFKKIKGYNNAKLLVQIDMEFRRQFGENTDGLVGEIARLETVKDKLEELASQSCHSLVASTPEEVLSFVVGQRSGHVRGQGCGPRPPSKSVAIAATIAGLQSQVKEKEERMIQMEEIISKQREDLNKIQEKLDRQHEEM